LVSADFHGAEVEVVRSRCAGRVGVRGIVVRDTKFTFVVVTEGDEVKSEFLSSFLLKVGFGENLADGCWFGIALPKEQTIFRFRVPLPGQGKEDMDVTEGAGSKKELTFELHGSQFQNRPVDRANKKFKWRNVDYL
jgi:ribonuclease P protein subunit POP4